MPEFKGYEASQKRLKKAQKEGNFAHSQVLTHCLALVAAGLTGAWAGGSIWVEFKLLVESAWGFGSLDLLGFLSCAGILSARVAILVLGGVFLVVFSSTLAQHRWFIGYSWSGLTCKSVSPFHGAGQVLTRLQKIWRPLAFLFFVAAGLCSFSAFLLYSPAMLEPQTIVLIFLSLVGTISIAYGCADYLLEKRAYRNRLSMSREELRREHKEEEGDPLLRSFRRAQHESLLMENLARRVRKAKVIVVERAV